MKAILRWEAPGPAGGASKTGERRGESQWDDVADALRHEGEWAVLFEGGRQAANNVRNMVNRASVMCFSPSGEFEACTRQKVKGFNGIITVYARYIGGDDA